MEHIFTYLFYTAIGFLSGSIVYSYFLPKIFYKKDILEISDDGNPGCGNVFKYVGVPMGVICLVLDFFKGYLPVMFACGALNTENILFSFVVAAPVAGHAFSPFLRGKGGKAITVTFGSLLALMPRFFTVWWLVIPFVVLSTLFRLNPHSLRVAASYGIMLGLSLLLDKSVTISLAVLLICISVLYRHLPKYFKDGCKNSELKLLNFKLWNK